jgi:hypothetical protein
MISGVDEKDVKSVLNSILEINNFEDIKIETNNINKINNHINFIIKKISLKVSDSGMMI